MSTIKKCERCGIQNNEYVRITATCKKCGKSYLICTTCKLSWKSQKCPACDAWIGSGTWNFLEMKGSGTVTDDMSDYLESFSVSNDYIKLWNDNAEKRKEEQVNDGNSKHRGVELVVNEVSFLRNLENILYEPIFTVADDRSNYVIVEDGHTTTLRLRNSNLTDNFPEEINTLSKLKELRIERTDRNKPKLRILPESITECKELESIVLRSQSGRINVGILKNLPNLRKLSVQNTFQGDSDDTVAQIFDISTLHELNLRQCVISMQVLEGVGKLTQLKKLNMAWMKEPNSSLCSLPNSMQNCRDLEELDVYGTYIGYTYPGQPWPDWIPGLLNLKLVHNQHRQLLNNGGPLFRLLYEKYPEIYEVPDVTPEMHREYSQSDWDNWFDKNKSEILRVGWSGIE